jgi:hypothetical protein
MASPHWIDGDATLDGNAGGDAMFECERLVARLDSPFWGALSRIWTDLLALLRSRGVPFVATESRGDRCLYDTQDRWSLAVLDTILSHFGSYLIIFDGREIMCHVPESVGVEAAAAHMLQDLCDCGAVELGYVLK